MLTPTRQKLIEVSLPLDSINAASKREKSIRHGHPSTLHLWWSRKPLATTRAVVFAQMVDDPGSCPEEFPTPAAQARERERLRDIIRRLVLWESTTDERVLDEARKEIRRSWRRAQAGHGSARAELPPLHDPFAGGGAIPLEAQRLGLAAHASDLNPVAVMINKAMIEIPPRFAANAAVNPDSKRRGVFGGRAQWGAAGLADDVRYYGQWMREEAKRRIGHLYPTAKISREMVRERPDLRAYEGKELTIIAWLWARTVKSPNPAFADVNVPLTSSFMLSTKKGKEAYVEPVVEGGAYRFRVYAGPPPDLAVTRKGTKAGGSGSPFLCMMSGSPMSFRYLRSEAKAGRMGAELMAVVAEGHRTRVYLEPKMLDTRMALAAKPDMVPETRLPAKALGFRVQEYGMTRWRHIFTDRQLVALTTFSDLVAEAMREIRRDAVAAGMPDDGVPLREGGRGATAYAEAVGVYLAFVVDKAADYWSSICVWHISRQGIAHTFGRQAIPMTWDYAEANPFSSSTGNWTGMTGWVARAISTLPSLRGGSASQADAAAQAISKNKVVSTDPPYYDNIGYADLSDFFYVWMRRSLRGVFPDVFATMAVPKADELVATPYRHGGRDLAEDFFMAGMTEAMGRLSEHAHPSFPVTIYYAFKQSERRSSGGVSSTGWETFLAAVIRSGLMVTGTWPMRTEMANRPVGLRTNALASSIVLVCRKRPQDAPCASRREFLTALRSELPPAVRHLKAGHIAPVDLAQAAIGPGMAVYTRYAKVLDVTGQVLRVREALQLINEVLDETISEQEGEFGPDTRWALNWFEQCGFARGEFGEANTLANAMLTSVQGLVQAGIVESGGGYVRLLRPNELPTGWDPTEDQRLTRWEAVHHLVRCLESGGEEAAGALARRLGGIAHDAHDLAYRLYTTCERKKWAKEALSYNALIQSWTAIMESASKSGGDQGEMFRGR